MCSSDLKALKTAIHEPFRPSSALRIGDRARPGHTQRRLILPHAPKRDQRGTVPCCCKLESTPIFMPNTSLEGPAALLTTTNPRNARERRREPAAPAAKGFAAGGSAKSRKRHGGGKRGASLSKSDWGPLGKIGRAHV